MQARKAAACVAHRERPGGDEPEVHADRIREYRTVQKFLRAWGLFISARCRACASAADRGRVGVCVPCGDDDEISIWDDEKLLDDFGWFAGNTDDQTHPVGLKKPNRWRLYDMHGNVLKWLSDWYDPGYYASSSREDPLRSSAVTRWVHRGGSYSSYANVCGGAYRHSSVPAYQWRSLGFRLAMSVP